MIIGQSPSVPGFRKTESGDIETFSTARTPEEIAARALELREEGFGKEKDFLMYAGLAIAAILAYTSLIATSQGK